MNASSLARMVDVLKGTWIYKFKAGDNKKALGTFTTADIQEAVYEEKGMTIRILITMKNGAVRLAHPHDLSMKELEALTTWAENLRGRNG